MFVVGKTTLQSSLFLVRSQKEKDLGACFAPFSLPQRPTKPLFFLGDRIPPSMKRGTSYTAIWLSPYHGLFEIYVSQKMFQPSMAFSDLSMFLLKPSLTRPPCRCVETTRPRSERGPPESRHGSPAPRGARTPKGGAVCFGSVEQVGGSVHLMLGDEGEVF